MKRFMKRTLLVATLLSTLMASTFSVSAANLKDIFNAKYYAGQYQDLQNTYGTNEKALYQHYLKYGMSEGRNASPILDVVAYRNTYADLNAAFGDNWDAYVNHYYTYGIKEHRNSGNGFDPIAYAEKYPDIKAAFGDDYAAIINHYLTYGIAEGRTCDIVTESSSSSGSSDSGSDHSSGSSSEDTSNKTKFKYYSHNGNIFGEITLSTRINGDRTLSEIMAANVSEVTAVDTSGASYPVDITWSCDSFDKDTVGIYWIIGTVSPADGTSVDYELPDVLACLSLTTTEAGFYGYYTFEELYGTTCAVKLDDLSFDATVGKGTDWSGVLAKLAVDVNISAMDKSMLRPVNIAWNCDNYDGNTPGTYTATGTVTSDAFSVALPDITATITVGEEETVNNLQFHKYAWEPTETSDGLPLCKSGDGYFVTYDGTLGKSTIPPLPIYVQGKDAVTGEIVNYDVEIVFDTTNYDCNTLGGPQIFSVAEINSTTPGFEIPFELPNVFVYVTVYDR